MKTILATGSDSNYLKKIIPYLQSIQFNSNFDENILVFVGENKIQNNLSKLKVFAIFSFYLVMKNSKNF